MKVEYNDFNELTELFVRKNLTDETTSDEFDNIIRTAIGNRYIPEDELDQRVTDFKDAWRAKLEEESAKPKRTFKIKLPWNKD